ncbi:spermidine synthase [Sphingobium sp.]|uniref:spermidine synthase n=1 Tax=Sphingobium sp. TaxID=1912891 RepID=UPI002CEE83DA|nr:spermidine synthase [Sphingobium sp.]HUD94455.1 spermidine synthase [Sphingobium sp.]
MGFTLRAVLAAWADDARVMVAELIPEILAWAHGPLAHLYGEDLSDPRLSLRIIDVQAAIGERTEQFDAILLDVDNGPDGFITVDNDRLYTDEGLLAAFAALRRGGFLSIWSSYRDEGFAGRLEAAGFLVDEVVMPAYVGSTDRWHNIWFAQKPGAPTGAAIAHRVGADLQRIDIPSC